MLRGIDYSDSSGEDESADDNEEILTEQQKTNASNEKEIDNVTEQQSTSYSVNFDSFLQD